MELGPEPLPNTPPAFAVKGVLAARAKLRALFDLTSPAELAVFDRITGVIITMCVGTVASLKIPDLLKERGALSAEEIAAAVDCHPEGVFRIMRALALHGVFSKDSSGKFENNRLSNVLLSGTWQRMREFAAYFASASNMQAWAGFEHCIRTNTNAFEHVHGQSVWDWFEEHTEERENFAMAMMGITSAEAPNIAKSYPFSEVQTMCDVGGGRGTLISELLIRHPHLKATLCDAPGVLQSARELLTARGVIDRVTFVPGSFFDEVPKGSDLYSLKHILHDWDDARCVKILKVVRAAMEPGKKLIVSETIVERDTKEVLHALADLQMMAVCSDGGERSRMQYSALFDQSGFRLGRVYEGAMGSVLEAVAI